MLQLKACVFEDTLLWGQYCDWKITLHVSTPAFSSVTNERKRVVSHPHGFTFYLKDIYTNRHSLQLVTDKTE